MNFKSGMRKHKIPPQAPKGDVKSGMRDEFEKSTKVTAPFRGLGADIGDESNLHPRHLFRLVGRSLGGCEDLKRGFIKYN
jgi:hypothetical protein